MKKIRVVCVLLTFIVSLFGNYTYTSAADITSLSMTPSSQTITGANKLGDAVQVTAIYSSSGPQNVTGSATFTSSNSSIATVYGGFIKSGTKGGTATITASYGGKTASCKVTVIIPDSLASLSMTPSSQTITGAGVLGDAVQVTAIYSSSGPKNVTSSATFTSSDSNIATVYGGFIKSGTKEGKASITASYGGKTASITVTVVIPDSLTSLSMTPSSQTITGAGVLGDAVQVTAIYSKSGPKNVTSSATFISSDSDIATVSGGFIKSGTKEGKATITASYGGKTASITVITVIPDSLTSLSITPSSQNITGAGVLGDAVRVTAIYSKSGPQNVTSSAKLISSDESIATVYGGFIKSGTEEGTATLTASYGGKTASITVTVIIPDSLVSLSMTPSSQTITGFGVLGDAVQVTAIYSKSGPKNVTSSATFTSSDSDIATVYGGFIKSGTKEGMATIAASYGGKTASCRIVCVPTPDLFTSLSMTPSSQTITGAGVLGDAVQVTAIYSKSGPKNVTSSATFTSSDSDIATVYGGFIKSGTKGGTATITASYGGKTASITVITVIPDSLTSLSMIPSSQTITGAGVLGEAVQVTAIYSKSGPKNVTSSAKLISSDESIATVSEGFIKSGTKGGKATITAS